jgi:protein-S-isoprenylcysteine O-methyltransferase Ste14
MEARKQNLISILQVVVVCYVLWYLFTFRRPWDWRRELGTALLLIGIIGIGVARFQLGRSFSIRPEAHRLVTNGIYSKVRNPIYAFGTISISGFVLIIHKPVGWLFVIAVIILQTIRAHREARVLEAAFGDAYREYRRKTWF